MTPGQGNDQPFRADSFAPPSEEAVLRLLLSDPRHEFTARELVERARISRATVGQLVAPQGKTGVGGRLAPLLERGRSRTAGPKGGARAASFRLRPGIAFVVGLDLGREHVRVAAQDLTGEIYGPHPSDPDKSEYPVDEDPRGAIRRASELALQLMDRERLDHSRIVSTVISTGAPVNRRKGSITLAGGAWTRIDLSRELGNLLAWTDEPVVQNDANLGALAEARFGAGRGTIDLAYVKWARGIGFGFVLGGELFEGADGFAGEHGHTPVCGEAHFADSVQCRCGRSNCLEAVASLQALVPKEMRVSKTPTQEESNRFLLAARSDLDGDDGRRLREAARFVGAHLGTLINVMNPGAIVIGGLFSKECVHAIEPDLRIGIEATAIAPAAGVPILGGEQTGRAAVVGALAYALNSKSIVTRLLREALGRA
jgi:predicted NBD/HSP70 family sugar kinase